MKKRILVALLALVLVLSGCTSMLATNFVSIDPHADLTATGEDPTVLRAETYWALVEHILSMVKQGATHRVIHLANYKVKGADVKEDLAAACSEVAQRDPLGAYAVDFIKHDVSYIVSYYEANIYITYRRTTDQMKSIVSVTGSSAIRQELRDALAGFAPEKVLRISYYNEDTSYIRSLILQAYYDTPAAAFGMPEIAVSVYPAADPARPYVGAQRIVELQLTYPEDQEILRKKSGALIAKAQALGGTLTGLKGEAAVYEITRILREAVRYLPQDSQNGPRKNTAYSALVQGQADSEGMALSFHLLCQLAGLEDLVVLGKAADGTPYFWNLVTLGENQRRHIDPSRGDGHLLSDADLLALGYSWDRGEYPLCGAQPEPEASPKPTE
ncbi:MAG: hypothetical protein RR281_02160 [Pseudoflavonifractor sp.]